MKKYEKLVLESFLDDEETVIQMLEESYADALDRIQKEAKKLQKQIDALDEQYKRLEDQLTDEEKEKLLSMQRAKVYQKQYQDSLKEQVSNILDKMHEEEFKAVDDYVHKCYDEGFLGAMYSLNQQGIPLCFPIDQKAVVRAVQLDSKIKQGLYKRLGEDVDALKKTIASEVSRGISTGSSYSQIAQQIKARMTGIYDKKSGGALYRAETIARTEGHRVQVQSAMDACYKAKDNGADMVKQWDSTLDGDTRPSHRKVDGEIRELGEKFSNGLMHPSDPDGGASEVINCRCALLQRARWALDEEELEELKKRAEYFGLDKTKNFEDFKEKYLKATESIEKSVKNSTMNSGAISGARNPFSDEAKEHAYRYYGLVRSMKTDVSRISKSTGIPEKEVQSVKDFIFYEKHDLGGSEPEYFEPDYMMAESWRRMIDGKPEPHDITLLKHEIMEKDLMSKGMTQEEAHIEASKKYNYAKEAGEYYAEIEKRKKK